MEDGKRQRLPCSAWLALNRRQASSTILRNTMAVSLTVLPENSASAAGNLALGRKPSWLKMKLPIGENYARLLKLVNEQRLHTVCQEARCPNMGECWSAGTATLMIL